MKNEAWDAAKEFQKSKGERPDSSKEFARAEHQARNDYQDSGGILEKRNRSEKSDTVSKNRGDEYSSSSESSSSESSSSESSSSESSSSESSSSGWCFFTTAAVEYKGLSDNCEELGILRGFRDTFLLENEEGKELVAQYYRIAPAIVARINTSPDRDALYDTIWSGVQKTVCHIKHGRVFDAIQTYKTLTESLEKTMR